MECVLARILLKLKIFAQWGVVPRSFRRGEVRKDGVLPREWESGVEGGYASRAACLHRVRSSRQGCRLATSALCRRTSDLSSLVTATGQKATLQFGSSEMQTQLPPLEYVASKGLASRPGSSSRTADRNQNQGAHEMRVSLSTRELRAAELVAAAETAGVWR